jgi:hypothetical protein
MQINSIKNYITIDGFLHSFMKYCVVAKRDFCVFNQGLNSPGTGMPTNTGVRHNLILPVGNNFLLRMDSCWN